MSKKRKSTPQSQKDELNYEYDPVKREIGGEQAEKVIWSTNSLNAAVKALNEGLPLKNNPFIGKDSQLLKPELLYKRTAEEIQDYMKCMEDIVYFASKCYLMTPEGLKPCVLRDYQVDYLNLLKNNRFTVFCACRQAGKSTTTAIYAIWMILFHTDKTGLILSKSGPAAADLLEKIKTIYRFLPYHLKIGTMKWNQGSISFDNNSTIGCEAFSPTAGLGKTLNLVLLDEFAWTPQNDARTFYMNVIPTVTTISDSNVCIMSTQNGHNLFYEIYDAAVKKKNIYVPFKVDWYQVPQFNPKTKQWEKRDEKWKEMMVGVLGSEEAFYYQYGTQFAASDNCLVSRECISRMRDKVDLFEIKEDLDITLQFKDNLSWDKNFDLEDLKTSWFFVLADLAEGGGGDFTIFNIFQVISDTEIRQVGTWKSNKVDLEHAALEYWLLVQQLFNNDRCLLSIEWNTYGALFYKIVTELNEPDYDEDSYWRFNIPNIDPDGIDQSRFVNYKKTSIEDDIALGIKSKKTSKYVPGIKFTGGNKSTACALLKMLLEKGQLIITSMTTMSELENFEDKNGSGSYKASFGHDDEIMTCCQIPMMQQTAIWKDYMEEFALSKIENKLKNNISEESIYGFIDTNESLFPSFPGSSSRMI
jgi:hypothetical protein